METKSVPYSFRKNGIFYFTRRVPQDLRAHYSTRRIAFSLKTRSAKMAIVRAQTTSTKLDQHWHFLRVNSFEHPAFDNFRATSRKRSSSPHERYEKKHQIKEVIEHYLKHKGQNKSKTFQGSLNRAFRYLKQSSQKAYLEDFRKADATKFRDFLFAKNLAGPYLKRVFSTIRAVFNFCISEFDIKMSNPFTNVFIDRELGSQKRQPILIHDIRHVQSKISKINDEPRLLLGLITDTGMRLAEAAGLAKDDIHLGDRPFIQVKPHPWRSLKTKSSERRIPLVGNSLFCAEKLVKNCEAVRLFSQYNKQEKTNANSASAALNKWLKNVIGKEYTVHGFRHSFRDRLRAVECPSEIIDQLGGWHTDGVGHQYGKGFPDEILIKWMKKLE